MKILKYIFLLLLLCGIAGFVFIATQPGNYSFKKSKEITVSKEVVFNFINNYNNWNLWNSNIEPKTSKETFSEDFKTYTISNGKESIVYETLAVHGTDSITQKATQNALVTDLTWKFNPAKEGTVVTCEMKGTLTLKQKILSVLQGGVQNYLGTEIDTNLSNIEKYLTHELNNYNIKISGIENYAGTLFIKQIDSTDINSYYLTAKNKIPNLIKFAQDNGIDYKEQPFVLFDKFDKIKNETKFSVCIPVKDEIITSEGSDVQGGELFEFNAVKITLIGDYSHLSKAWEEGFKYIKKNKLEEDQNGTYIESYKSYSPNESQPSKWITEIYIPIKSSVLPKKKPVTNQSIEPLIETNSTPNE